MQIPRVVTIAGSDSGGCAGIQADLKTFTALNVFGASVITALTAQNTVGVQAVHVPPSDFIEQQMESIFSDISFSTAKTGMLPSSDIIRLTAATLRRYSIQHVVVDPVLVASSGDSLVKGKTTIQTMIDELFPLASVVTPNIPEAEQLTGLSIRNTDDMRRACEELVSMGCKSVLLKGGHLNEDQSASQVSDILYNGESFNAFSAKRIDTKNTHGTGCTLASAVAACLARGDSLEDAVACAKQFVHCGIANGLDIGSGCGPLYHMHTVNKFP